MTTTAHEDQFTVAPEPVHQPYSTADILRRNVADLEIALRKQTERAEAAEAELAKLRKQKPVAWINLNKWTPSNGPRCVTHEEYEKERELLTKLTAVYAAPVPAPAVLAVPDGDDFNGSTPHLIQCMEALVRLDADGVLVPHGIGRDASKLLSAAANRLRQQAASSMPEEWRETLSKLVGIVESSTKFHGCDDVTKQARALLQSSEVTDNAAADRLLEGGE